MEWPLYLWDGLLQIKCGMKTLPKSRLDNRIISLISFIFSNCYERGIYGFFLLLGLYGIVKWVKDYKFKSIILAMSGFIGATFFHGGMFVGGLIFLVIVGINAFKSFLKLLINYKINLKILFILIFFITSSFVYLSNQINIPYLGTFENSTDIKNLLKKTDVATRGDASWPRWTTI